MIDGVGPREAFPARSSRWLHLASTGALGHFIPAELDTLRRCLDSLLAAGVPLEEIMCISPFRDTANRLGALVDEYGPALRAGTIHTVQGQEADVVFFVLGGDPGKPGAKRWASRTPNLVNVAVSRAKRRLYVIGDQKAWSPYPFFRELSEELDRHTRSAGD